MNCDKYYECLNNANCVLCNNQRLLKLSTDKRAKSAKAKFNKQAAKTDTRNDSTASWTALESTVASALNIPSARRQTRSGAIWFMPGDIVDDVLLIECKERSSVDSKGKSQIVIKKEWLDKILKESDGNRYPALVFRYKDSPDIYFTQKFEVLCDMVSEIKYLREELAKIKEQSVCR